MDINDGVAANTTFRANHLQFMRIWRSILEPKDFPFVGAANIEVPFTPNAIESFPKATHTIQSECRIMFDRRLLPGDDPKKAVDQMKAAIGSLPEFPGTSGGIAPARAWTQHILPS